MKALCVDLCSGLGGMSRAFVDAGWEVVTVDVEAKFNPTICQDIRTVTKEIVEQACRSHLTQYDKVVVLASPPCQRFSIAMPKWPLLGIREAFEIVGAVFGLIEEIKPDFWLVENPKGRLRWFVPNKPIATINLSDYGYPSKKPTDLWGNIPLPMIETIISFARIYSEKRQRQETWIQHQGRDPAKRAEMPLGLSKAILQATTQETAKA